MRPYCLLFGVMLAIGGLICPSIATANLPPIASSTTTVTSTVPSPAPTTVLSSEPPAKPSVVTKTAENRMGVDELLKGLDQTGSPSLPPTTYSIPDPSAEPGVDRPLPQYEGREAESANAAEMLIWIPRVAFFPVHLVFEYLVRWPIVTGITAIEEYYVLQRIERFFTWRDGKSGVYPSFFADFGLRPSVGLTTFHRDIFFKGNTFNAVFGTWGPRWVNIVANNETLVLQEDTGKVILNAFFDTRPDQPFYGVGSNTNTDDEVNFRWQRFQGSGAFLASLGGLSRLGVSSAIRHVDFLDDPEAPAISPADAMMLPGHDVGSYEIIESRLDLKLDSRDPDTEFKGGTGLLLELFGAFAFDFTDTSRNYARWGVETAAFYDFTERGHVVALRLHSEFIEDTGGSPVPFTELASLGGIETMRGFLPRRFLGESAISGTFSYRYPVWSLLDAEVFAEVGNAFGNHLEGFRINHLHFSSGAALRTSLDRDVAFTILFAVGTNRFDNPDFRVDSYRFTFGLTQGF